MSKVFRPEDFDDAPDAYDDPYLVNYQQDVVDTCDPSRWFECRVSGVNEQGERIKGDVQKSDDMQHVLVVVDDDGVSHNVDTLTVKFLNDEAYDRWKVYKIPANCPGVGNKTPESESDSE